MGRNCFIVTSCIYPCEKPLSYTNTRTIYNPEERNIQTQNTIKSIREKCPNAKIVLVDNGIKAPDQFEGGVDQIYLGNKILFRKAADSPNKSLGESLMLLYCMNYLKKTKEKFDYIFKISGRYWLNEHFCIENFEHDAFCFLNLGLENRPVDKLGFSEYIIGFHSTRLYSLPGKCIKYWKKSILMSLRLMLKNQAIEIEMPPRIQYPIYYVRELGVSGYIGFDKTYIQE